ncbi:MAG: redoxin domain-containing protein [Candidatus Aminicenantes bacterium]|nr:redoxin domain-containing protein [Candidatus Aminicenantes bacterium]NIM78258.1 redoxin domain-containing protein [Candidatus Aminicenantes bacterium]NIN19683.1 redoxin domain-containing protein [Candidatus Aminicenantes bacterium]NIN43565.1 redoxin domain-containing protein [Candidatus Aminicenantes bacterium]NIN86310.1 redoxin domain-containing protein [Candidatus Aminicenantes bacterium]
MNKPWLILISTLLVFVSMTMRFNFSLLAEEEQSSYLQAEYESLHKNVEEKAKTIKTRNAYKKLIKEHTTSLEMLLEKVKNAAPDDQLELLKGKVLSDLKKKRDAVRVFDELIQRQSPVANQAKFENVRLLLEENKIDEALPLFREIEDSVEKNKSYFWVLLDLAFSSKKMETKEEYSLKFINAVGNSKEYENFKALTYKYLAEIEKDRDNLKKGIEILEKAAAEFTTEQGRGQLRTALKRIKMIGAPAPELPAETWINCEPLNLEDLKGKAVVIVFWAPWSEPSRRMIPLLLKNYNQYKDEGLVVIGISKIYGSYSDDTRHKDNVPKEVEISLIHEFARRYKITYPVAISDAGGVFETYGVRGIPALFLIDKEGIVTDIKVGSGDPKGLEEKIKELLK